MEAFRVFRSRTLDESVKEKEQQLLERKRSLLSIIGKTYSPVKRTMTSVVALLWNQARM